MVAAVLARSGGYVVDQWFLCGEAIALARCCYGVVVMCEVNKIVTRKGV